MCRIKEIGLYLEDFTMDSLKEIPVYGEIKYFGTNYYMDGHTLWHNALHYVEGRTVDCL